MDTSVLELPTSINVDPIKYYKSTRDVCYWTNEKECSEEIICHFIDKAKEYNFTEDQALAILMFNNFDMIKSEYDMHIYRPLKGLGKIDVKQLVKLISDGITKTVKAREHRDFDDVHLMFPGFTVGDVLGAYSKHRFLIKKETYKMKKSVKKSTLKPYLTNGGLKEVESGVWNESCSDTQFHLIYQKHYAFIRNSCEFEEVLARDYRLVDAYNDNETDGILTLLRKMNRKKSKPGSMFERYQLSNMLNSAALEKRCRSQITGLSNGDDSKHGSSRPASPIFSNKDAVIEESSLDNRLYEYIKSENNQLLLGDYADCDDREILATLKTLSEHHEAVLESFKDFLPDPNIFQQLCHSWSNMDFAILLLGLTEFGIDFQKISDSIFTKSEAMVASFYINHCLEFNLDDIVTQPFSKTEFDPVSNDNSLDNLIPPAKIKVEDLEQDTSSICPTSNASTTTRSKNSSKSKSKMKKKTTKTTTKTKPVRAEESCPIKEGPMRMSLRSRLETKSIMKSLIDEEIKLKNMKFSSKKNLKRKPNGNKNGNQEANQRKRIKKEDGC